MIKYILAICGSFSFLYGNSQTKQLTKQLIDGEIIKQQTYLNPKIQSKESSTSDYIGIYQKYISAIRGQECPMYPSCSNFGLKSFKESSFSYAFILTSDRLLRCGHDHTNYNLTLRKNGFKYLDYPLYDSAPQDLYYKKNQYFFSYSDTLQDADSRKAFIKNLINDELFHEALLEIKRLQHYERLFDIELFINEIICLKALGEFEKAIFLFELKCPIEFRTSPELLYQESILYYKLGNYNKALNLVTTSLSNCTDEYLKIRLITLQGILYANNLNWQQSLNSFNSLEESTYQSSKESKISIVKTAFELKDKAPWLASSLSLIPGLGYAYSGHKQTAISSFVINGLLAYATYTSFKNKNYGIGILTGVFNISFYIGNIYGSGKSAKRYNEQQRKEIIDKLEYNLNP